MDIGNVRDGSYTISDHQMRQRTHCEEALFAPQSASSSNVLLIFAFCPLPDHCSLVNKSNYFVPSSPMQLLQTPHLKNKTLTEVLYQRRDRGRLEGIASGRGWTFAFLTALVFSHTSCKRSETGEAAPDVARPANTEDSVPGRKVIAPAPVAKVPDTPPMSSSVMGRIVRMTALVQIPDQPERTGILLEGAAASSSHRNYLVICEAPAELESVSVAYQSSGKTGKALAKRISILPSGLSLYGFATKSSLSCYRLTDSATGDTFHAIRLKGEGSISPEEKAAMTSELETIRSRLSALHKEERESMRAATTRQPMPRDTRRTRQDPRRMQRERMREVQQVRAKIRSEMKELSTRQSEIRSHLKFPVAGIAGVEVAAAAGRDGLEAVGGNLEHTLLVTKPNMIVALRFQGKWLDLAEILSSSGNQIEHVQFELSGQKSSIYLSCKLAPILPSASNKYSMVAATTYELESQGSGSIEERLASVKPVPFQGRGSSLSVSQQLKWNGSKTKLWVKVFNDQHPDELILDEVILLDYPGSLSPRWDKPPSPLITIPESKPDTPENLVSGSETLDAKGEIRDIVAAGDGSVVMIRTNQPPFWAPLDMKTGQWMTAPWKATAETLLATQAGKIYLIDRKTGMLEIWGLTSGKREGLQILPLTDPIVSAVAPLSDPDQPLMIATVKGCYFIDPVKFEVLPSNLNLGDYFDQKADKRRGTSPLDPASLCLRASDDGSLYTFSGISTNTERRSPSTVTLTVDRSAMVVSKISGMQFLASHGRNTARGYPDHGGSATSVMPMATNARFPAPMGQIRFMNDSGREAIAVLASLPVLPKKAGEFNGALMPDRGTYFDSSFGVLLLPDGNKLHLVHLNIPKQEEPLSKFIFAGESLEIPLPAGTGHKLTSKDGGTSEIGPTSIRWVAPVAKDRNRQYSLRLEWTGELGSQIHKDYRIQVLQSVGIPEVMSPDGGKNIPLHRRIVLNEVDSDIVGFAGSGTVVLVNESGSFSAWNLFTGELMLRRKLYFNRILGDADRIYVLDQKGQLTSFDILTGQELGRADVGKKIRSIVTGMSCRNALLAVEQEGVDGFLIQIPRDSLKPLIIDLPQETRRKLFMPRMVANASGSAIWSRQVGIFRDSRAITVKPIPYNVLNGLSDGVPDASGKIIVGRNAILNLAAPVPKPLEFSKLPGLGDSPQGKLDQSGRYLLFTDPKEDPLWRYISLRDVRQPSREVMKIRYPSTENLGLPYIISGTNTLVQFQRIGGRLNAVVYDLNIPKLIKELSR
jgi:hypothetical protein